MTWRQSAFAALLTLAWLMADATAGEKANADRARIADHFKNGKQTPWTWVFYGDSLTHGAAHTVGWRSFPEIFGERVRWELAHIEDAIIQSGTSGATTVYLLDDTRYDFQVRRYRPNVVFLLIGSNDITRVVKDPNRYRANLEQLVDRIRADGGIPVLQTTNTMQPVENPVADWQKEYLVRYREYPAYAEVVRRVAAERDVLLVDHFAHWPDAVADAETLDLWLDEPLHPGPKGHQEMAILICKELGLYAPDSRCLTLLAGGVAVPPSAGLERYFAAFDTVAEWPIHYRAADGLPGGDWVSDYPPGSLSIRETGGAPVLHVNNSGTGADEYRLVRLAATEKIKRLDGVMLLEARLRLPSPPTGTNKAMGFYFGAVSAMGDKIGEPILLLSNQKFDGTLGAIQNVNAGEGFFRLRLVSHPGRQTAALWVDDRYLGTFPVQRVTKDGPNVQWGDGSAGVGGEMDLEYFKVTSVPAKE